MIRKKQVLILGSIALVASIALLPAFSITPSWWWNPFKKIWEAIYDLQDRVTSLEESMNVKTWHFVTNFTLAVPDDDYPGKVMSSHFSIQGERWRITWEKGGALGTTGWAGFIVCDENGYVIDAFRLAHGVPVMDGRYPAKGVFHVHQGEGSYYIELHNMRRDGVTFVIESYH